MPDEAQGVAGETPGMSGEAAVVPDEAPGTAVEPSGVAEEAASPQPGDVKLPSRPVSRPSGTVDLALLADWPQGAEHIFRR